MSAFCLAFLPLFLAALSCFSYFSNALFACGTTIQIISIQDGVTLGHAGLRP